MGLTDKHCGGDDDDKPSPPLPVINPIKRIRNDYFPWRRLFIILVGIAIELSVWRWAVNHLYALPVTSVSVFGSLTTSLMYTIAFLVAYFVTGQAYFTNWTNTTIANISTEVKSYIETKKSKETKIGR